MQTNERRRRALDDFHAHAAADPTFWERAVAREVLERVAIVTMDSDTPFTRLPIASDDGRQICWMCEQPWPCPTLLQTS